MRIVAVGLYLLVVGRRPRALARIRPSQLALWSFAVALAHGAGLMLIPVYLGLCGPAESGASHRAATALIGGNFSTAMAVSGVHVAAMIASSGAVAFVVHEWLGVGFISKSWFNLDIVWASSLILVGALGAATALGGH